MSRWVSARSRERSSVSHRGLMRQSLQVWMWECVGAALNSIYATSFARWILASMKAAALRTWALYTSLYFVAGMLVLCMVGRGDYFCIHLNKYGYLLPAIVLAGAVTVWDFIASCVGSLAAKFGKRGVANAVIAALVLVAVMNLPSLVFEYRDTDTLFANTWADVSCLMSEGYGMMFPYVVAPLFTALTLVKALM